MSKGRLDDVIGEMERDAGIGKAPRNDEPRTFLVIYASEFKVVSDQPLVRGLLGQGEFAAIIGAPGSFKTTVAVDLACSIAHGLPFLGREVTEGAVLFVELEGEAMLKHRVLAWHTYHGLELHAYALGMTSVAVSLAEGADSPDVAAVVRAGMELSTFGPLRLIVVDTLACAAGGLDENSAADMSKLVAALRAMGASTGAAVLVLHHTGLAADSRARGSSALRGALDVELLVKRAPGVAGGTITAEKMRNREIPKPATFEAVTVTIGTDDRGDPITAAVTIASSMPVRSTEKPLSDKEKSALAALDTLLAGEGTRPPHEAGAPDGQRAIADDRWQREFISLQSSTAKADSHRKAFDRAVNSLIESGLVVRRHGWCWKRDDIVLEDV